MTVRPLVSVVTPTYQQADFLEDTMLSLFGQTYPEIEYIVIDGGSTDGSAEIIRRYSDRLAFWQSQPDRGIGDALRQGFSQAKGKYLAYLNSDDLMAPDLIERAVSYLESHPDVALVYGDRACIDETGALLYIRPALPILGGSIYASMVIGQESCVWCRSAYQAVGGMDPSFAFTVDYDLFSRMARVAEVRHVRGIWGFFRKHDRSKTMTQYRDLGKREIARVQMETWGGRAWRPGWLVVLFLCRFYGLATGLFARLHIHMWPEGLGLRRKATFEKRLAGMFPEGAPLAKVGKVLARIFKAPSE